MELPLKKNYVSITLLRSNSSLLMFTPQQSSVVTFFFLFKILLKPLFLH